MSICIPTYNNPQRMSLLLDCLAKQDLGGVELVIRDDSQADDTEKIVGKYARLPIRYFHGAKEGFDAAILFLTKEACGDYIWWFGDDLMEVGIVDKIKKLISRHPDLSFVWLNSRGEFDPDSAAFRERGEKFFKSRNEIIEMDIGLLAYISSTIVKREHVLPFLAGAEKHKGENLMSFYLVLGALTFPGRYYYIGHPYILSKPKPAGEIRWYDQFQVWCVNLFKIVREFKGKFDERSVKKALKRQLCQVIKAILVERAMGLKTGFASPSPKIWPMLKLYWNFWEVWVAMPLLILPHPVLTGLYRLYKKNKKTPDKETTQNA